MKKILYISYDGMTDPLGQSQVINYLLGLRTYGYQFDILSFEKPDKFQKQGSYIQELLDKNGIGWFPQEFHHKPPVISKLYDKAKLMHVAEKLHRKNNYSFIHCRSYPAAEVALRLKKRSGVKFLFDMRGFWPDEKADGGHWDQKKWFWRKVYAFYKKKEKEFIENADHIISLTRTGKKEIESFSYYKNVPVTVIPCCANTDKFLLKTPEKNIAAKKLLSIPAEKFVLSYLGSLGTWYMIDEMLLFFSDLKKRDPNAFFLLVSNSDPRIITDKLSLYNIKEEDVKIINVPFPDVPVNMYASDISISFIRPVYSKIASSPVKIGEILSMGIPVIANNIGDSGLFIKENRVGAMVDVNDREGLLKVINNPEAITHIDPKYIRNTAMEEYSLEKGVKLYQRVYEQLLEPQSSFDTAI